VPYQIPKRIIQTGRHADQPLRTRAMIANLKLLNPDYEYLFFDDQQVQAFIDREFRQYRGVFDSFPFPIQRYDFFRYLAVYRYGGFYFDLDVLLAEGLSELLDSGCVFPFEAPTLGRYLRTHHNIDWEIGNYAFGAAAGHPFLEAVIENCVRAQKDPRWVKLVMRGFPPLLRSEYLVLNTTGPGLITRTLAENAELGKSVTVLFPENLSDMRNWNCFGHYGVHLGQGSWRTKGAFLRRRLVNYWESWKSKRFVKHRARAQRSGARGPKGNSSKPVERGN
jgi:inositol phosphorylceramide mannosyltransferase catalytic subunit